MPAVVLTGARQTGKSTLARSRQRKGRYATLRDVGLALHLSGHSEATGAHLENLVLHDLLVWRDARAPRVELHHWRTTDGSAVDIVVEADGHGPRRDRASAARSRA